MGWESLIRRCFRYAPEAAFAGLLGAALLSGGEAALAGVPRFLDALLPGMTAQAQSALARSGSAPGGGHARFALGEGFAESRYSPQVLFPVAENPVPDWLAEAVRAHGTPALRGTDAPLPSKARPVIAIVMDDLGADIAGTDRAMMLPRAVALSFLPYADSTPFLAEAAAKRGHMILAHVPMQPLRGTSAGPMALLNGMDDAEITRRLEWNLSRVPQLSGINNHEGSRFTAEAAGLVPVARVLAARGLFFFDSRTGPVSQVGAAARAAGIATAERDVFLDDQPGAAEVEAQLAALVAVAKRTGVAIAIGHPRDATLTVLSRWLKADHGVTLVPLDEAMRLKAARASAFAAR